MPKVGSVPVSRVVVVTGASAGIGRTIACRRADAGDSLVITGRRRAALEAAARSMSGPVLPVVCDAGAPEAGRQIVEAALAHFGRLDVVVANAAHVPPQRALLDADDTDIDRVWQTNVAAPLRLVRAAWQAGFAEHGGTVVMIGSLGGQSLQPDMGLYGASKAALHHLTRALAAELGPLVRVNAVAPGLVKTEGSRVGWEPAEQAIASRSPLGRLGETDDVADAVDFLLGLGASWVTGQVLVIDGGASVQLGRPNRTRSKASVT